MQTGNSGETFVFFGIVGSGKGTQVKLLQNYLKQRDGKECVYVGTGEIFRNIMASSTEDLSKQWLKEMLHAGKLIPDSDTNKLVWDTLKLNEPLENKNLVFDGYPRTLNQSQDFEKMVENYHLENIKIIYIELTEAEAMKRNLLRGRHDDTEEGLEKRFEEYRSKVIPAMDYFKTKDGYKVYTINGEQSVEDVHKDIIKAINS